MSHQNIVAVITTKDNVVDNMFHWNDDANGNSKAEASFKAIIKDDFDFDGTDAELENIISDGYYNYINLGVSITHN